MRKIYLLILLASISNYVFGQAFTGTYNFANVTTSSGTTDPTPVPIATGLTFGSFVAIGTPVNPNATARFSFTDWSLGATNGSDVFTGGIVTTEYYEVTLTPSASYSIDLNSITFTLQRSGTGIRQYSVRSSIDGYTANLPASINPANANLSVVPTNIFQVTDAVTTAQTGSTITLDATYDNLTSPVTFRFYGWNAEAAGGTFSIDDVVFNGVATFSGPLTNFYSKSAGNLTDVLTWGINTDGSGTTPTNFTTNGQIFNVVNRVSATLDANWTVSGASSKVIVGDGLSGTTLILPAVAALTGTIDVSNLGVLQIINTTLPTYGTLSLGSTVDYAQTSSPYTVPTGTTYHHLKLTGNIKTFASGTISVNGNLVVDGVTGFNGSASPFTTLNLGGDFTLQNAAAFEPIATGEGNRMTLTCSGSSTQTLSGANNFYLFRVQTPVVSTVNIVLGAGSNLTLGNPSGGGLNLQNASNTLSLGGNTLTIYGSGNISVANLGTLTGSSTSNLIINKTAGGGAIGQIGFTSGGQQLNSFSYNSSGSGTNNLTLLSSLTAASLNMTSGLIIIGINNFTVSGTATGVTSSYVQTNSTGNFILSNVTGLRGAPIGNSTYNPLTITNTSGHDWTLRVEDVLTVTDPVFASNTAKAVKRMWHITPSVNPPITGADLVFQYNDGDPTQIGASYNTAEMVQIWRGVASLLNPPYDWISVGVAQNPTGSAGGVRTASITNWSSYSPFAISNISGPLPVKIIEFSVKRISTSHAVLNWELADYCSSDAKFEIEKSTDGNLFSAIATVSGSESNKFYNSHDYFLAKGKNYYRVKAIEVGGKITYSKIIAIINDTKGVLITSLTPNPVNDQASVVISAAKAGTVSFVVYDIAGRPVKQWKSSIEEGSNNINVNTTGLPNGIYHLSAVAEDSKTVMRFIKQ